MTRDYGQEIDQLREELREIKEMLRPKEEDPRTLIQKIPDMHPDPHIQQILSQLEDTCEEKNQNGAITWGYASGGRQSTWIRHQVNADDLLKLIENRMAERCYIYWQQRPPQLLLRVQKTDGCPIGGRRGLTGQVYHHLKPLIAADLIVEDPNSETRGTYIVQPHRVQGIIMLLAGISDMLDPSFTKGEWHE